MWRVGDRILDLYEVEDVHRHGGMGVVYRVRHRAWNVDLALKSPRPELFRSEADRQRFVREAETWVALGLHPHVCSCHYVRTIDGIPRVFAEYVDGGSLREWIDDRRLYRGTSTQVLARILDLAIQLAWGLEHAHGHGVVHQDVKPANVLLDVDGTAKITDFGLAKAKDLGPGQAPGGAGKTTVLVTVAGATPAYASPEQVAGAKVSRRTDIWSFAVSVLEMFTGEVTWPTGAAAGAALADHRRGPADRGHDMPASVAQVLAQCLRERPERRPAGMSEVAGHLVRAYEQEIGQQYRRIAPTVAELRADELNNKALSLLDIGRTAEAESCFQQARTVAPQHPEIVYNSGLHRWRDGTLPDDALVKELRSVLTDTEDTGKVRNLLAQVHLERGDTDSALPLLRDAIRQAPQDVQLRAILRQTQLSGTPGYRCLRTLDEHTASIRSVCMSADGRLAFSGDGETVRVWDAASGRCLHVLEGHTETVDSVAVTPDGRLALTGSYDETVRVWDAASGRCLHVLEGHTESVYSVAVSADGRLALSGSQDETVQVWDLRTGRCRRVLHGHTDEVASVALRPDGRLAVSSSWDGTVRVWDVASGRCVHTLEGHPDTVRSLAVSADGRLALSGGKDGTVRVWDVESGRCLRVLGGHIRGYTGGVCSVSSSADGRLALSGGTDHTVRVWDVATGRCLRTLEGHTHVVEAVSVSADGRLAVSGGMDGTVRVWELPVPSATRGGSFQICRPRSHAELASLGTRVEAMLGQGEQAVEDGRLSAAFTVLAEARAISGHDRAVPRVLEAWGKLARYSRRTGLWAVWPARNLEGHTGQVFSVSLSADGRLALTGGEDRTVRVWDAGSGRCRHVLEGHTDMIFSVSLSADGRRALSGSWDGTVRVWDAGSGRCLRVLEGHTDNVSAVAVSADGRLVLSGGRDGTVRVWDAGSGRCLRVLEGHTDNVSAVAVSADGRLVLSGGGWDRTVRVWDVATGRCLRILECDTKSVSSVVVSADGRLALSNSSDGVVQVWDLTSGRCLRTLDGHTNLVGSVSLSADGRLVLSGGSDRTMRLWDVATGRCLRILERHTGRVSSVSLSADGRLALSGNGDRTVSVWQFDWDLEIRDWADWDEGARSHLETFLSMHTPVAFRAPADGELSGEQIRQALSRQGRPSWSDADFDGLIRHLQYAGYGWLRTEGIKAELERMARGWAGPPPLPGQGV